jgi:dihydroorotate dehydrogenase (NAD+) catalytic subunit
MVRAFKMGASCIVSKSIGQTARNGFSGPNIVFGNGYVINAMGLPNPGLEASIREINEAAASGARIIGSIYGFSEEEYAEVAKAVAEAKVDAIELNLSCPTVEKTGVELGQDPGSVKSVVDIVKSQVRKPVIVKLTPNVTNIIQIGKAAVDAGADALTAINTLKGMAIDPMMMKPILSTGFGGISGPAIKPVAVKCIYDLYEKLDVPIIGCGGIMNGLDAVEFLLAGATAVQVGTTLLYRDMQILKLIKQEIKEFLNKKGILDINSIIGKAH